MLILVPFRNVVDCRGFIFDLITMQRPDIVIIDYPEVLDSPANSHSRYANALDDVTVLQHKLPDAIREACKHTDKSVLILSTVSVLQESLKRNPELTPIVQRTILYPSPADLKMDTVKIINSVTGVQ